MTGPFVNGPCDETTQRPPNDPAQFDARIHDPPVILPYAKWPLSHSIHKRHFPMSQLCYINGAYRPLSEAVLPVNDLGVLRGYAVFDFIRTYGGRLFHPAAHLRRLRRSAAALGIPLQYSDDHLLGVAEFLIRNSGLAEAGVRFLLTGGDPGAEGQRPNLIATAEALPPRDRVARPLHLLSVDFRREFPDIKTTNYVNALRLREWRVGRHGDDLLYYCDDRISECPRGNFFAVFGDRVVTPKRDILAGITRDVVIAVARRGGPVECRDLTLAELRDAEAAFVTASSRGIVPVARVDDIGFDPESAGARMRDLSAAFEAYVRDYAGGGTPIDLDESV